MLIRTATVQSPNLHCLPVDDFTCNRTVFVMKTLLLQTGFCGEWLNVPSDTATGHHYSSEEDETVRLDLKGSDNRSSSIPKT
jgi:hypothetical protein